MSNDPTARLHALQAMLRQLGAVAVAVSGGVDSMTLAWVAQHTVGITSTLFHAVSAAVPPAATARVRRYAADEGWRLELLDAGEFDDPQYLHNPVDRCYYCKTHLYRAIARRTGATIVSGANRDDLDDYRPGLAAASHCGVRHPLLEAGIDKAAVRAIARQLGLHELADLPAAPCLSSRVETGLHIQPAALALIYQVERLLARRLQPRTVRCRVRRQGVAVELDPASLAALSSDDRTRLADAIEPLCRAAGLTPFQGFQPYRRGSAFVRDWHHA